VLRKSLWSLAFCLLITVCSPVVRAQTINAASCSASDVQNALNSASAATTTVVIPSGTCTWTTQVSYSVPANVTSLTIQGQTTVNCTGTPGTSSYTCEATDNTVLVDSYDASNGALLNINVGGASALFRITGITFEGGAVSSSDLKANGWMTFGGSTNNFRIDHCHFDSTTYTPLVSSQGGFTIFSPIYGVVDHNLFKMYSEGNAVRYYSGSGDFGDTAFAQPTNFGTSTNFLFLENDVFQWGAANDCSDGAKMVIRYSTIISNPNQSDTGLWQTHAMGQGQYRNRGCRALEVYHNYEVNPNGSSGTQQYTVGDGDDGTGLVWGNTLTAGYSYDVNFENFRTLAITGFIQEAPPNGVGYCGNVSSGVDSPWDLNTNATTGYPCLGQTGRGQGDLINGENFPNMLDTVTGTETWPHQLLEPWYIFDETVPSSNYYNNPSYDSVQMLPNRDFYAPNSSCSGSGCSTLSTGTGYGTFAQRPTTCTAGPGGTYGQSPTGSFGVAYWATDTDTLYICTSTNTWTAVYTPYTYPHPLVNGSISGNGPDPPTGLTATVQ
jgi:hypothetical protein